MTTYQTKRVVSNLLPHFTEDLIIKQGQKLEAGAVVGIDNNDKCSLSATASSDGSQDVLGVLLNDVDATSSEMTGSVAVTGAFIPSGLTFGTGHTEENLRATLRKQGIYFVSE